MQYYVVPNETREKITFLKTASSAGSKIGNYSLSLKVFVSSIGPNLNSKEALVIVET
jgi:hypothetical protein